MGLLAALSPNFALAQKVAPGDARIKTESVEIASPNGYGKARLYIARPAQTTGPLPVVLVAHENRGLNPHIEDIARRLALDNFIAVAPDALFPLGGYPGEEDKARELFAKLDQSKSREDFVNSARYSLGLAGGNGKLGCVGFCFGGSVANMLATRVPELLASVPFYGGARHEAHFYPGTQHGFNNDTTPRFDDAQAKVAWGRTLALFNRSLR